jgi:hypothetical protein
MKRSRGRKRAPGEIVVAEWKGTEIEQAFVSIHPERFRDVQQVALATLYVVGNEVLGSRRNAGARLLGVNLETDGNLIFTPDEKGEHAKQILAGVLKELGSTPEGFAEMPPSKVPQPSRMKKYACEVCGQIIRAASEDLSAIHKADMGFFKLWVKPVKAEPEPVAEPQATEELTQVPEHVPEKVMVAAAGGGPRNFGIAA